MEGKDRWKSMKKELEYFTIEEAFGGNQDWFTNVVMNIGGCAAATACDSCIYFAKYLGMEEWYPYDISHLTREEYKSFSQMMKPYLRPRVGGVKKLEWYIEGLDRYVREINEKRSCKYQITMEEFSESVNAFLEFRRYDILKDNGKIDEFIINHTK